MRTQWVTNQSETPLVSRKKISKVDLGALPGAPLLKFVVMVDKTAFEVFVCERLGHDPETVGAACVTAAFMQGSG